MNRTVKCARIGFLFLMGLGVPRVEAQQPAVAEPQAPSGTLQASHEVVPLLPVPRLVKFAGALKDEQGKPPTGTVGVTFAIYKEQEGGAALWMETQNVELDEQGRYTVLLGATKSEGLPLELFNSGDPRWLGVQVNLAREVEQPRVLLVSVPYALKAADADTLGGKPLSAFLLAGNAPPATASITTVGAPAGSAPTPAVATCTTPPCAVVTPGGTTGFLSNFSDATTIQNSPIFASNGQVGIGTTNPQASLDVQLTTGAATNALNSTITLNNSSPITGSVLSAFKMTLLDQSTASNLSKQPARFVYLRDAAATGGVTAFDSVMTATSFLSANAPYPLRGVNIEGPTMSSGTTLNSFTGLYVGSPGGAGTVTNRFALVTEPNAGNVGIGTTGPTQKLEVAGNLKVSGAGNAILFPDGSVMSSAATGVGGGTITGVTAGAGLTGGGTAGGVALSIPNGGITNSMLAANSVTNASIADGSLSPAKITGGVATLGANTFTGAQILPANGLVVGGNQLVTSGGNVGIGTQTPAARLEVSAPGFPIARFTNNGTGTDKTSLVDFLNGDTASTLWRMAVGGTGNGIGITGGQFYVERAGAGALMLITPSGNVGIGTTTPSVKLDVNGGVNSSGPISAGQLNVAGELNLPNTASATVGVISLGSAPFLHNFGTNNTFVGASAGNMSMTGTINSAYGASALNKNTTGSNNSAFGGAALLANTTGGGNSAFGSGALQANTINVANSAFGESALQHNNDPTNAGSASNNSAFGAFALQANTTGFENSAFGGNALLSNTTASDNSAFGANALRANATGNLNSAFGASALSANTTAIDNSAFGANALNANTAGFNNSAFGANALASNTTGPDNAAFGSNALQLNTIGGANAAFGQGALQNNNDSANANNAKGNSAFGFLALNLNSTGPNNSAFGALALSQLLTGSGNIGIGLNAGVNFTSSESNNIVIGSLGLAGQSNAIRIGDLATQTAAFIAGIRGVTTVNANAIPVVIDSAGQLGTMSSSRRVKQDIRNMGDTTDTIMGLRPVRFRYKAHGPDGPEQYGLVAEEVAEVAPDLVARNRDGEIETVFYDKVNAILLNEVQKQQRTIQQQQAEIEDVTARLAKLEVLIKLKP